MKKPDKNKPGYSSDPDNSHTVGADTNYESQSVEDNESVEEQTHDSSTWPGGDQTLEELQENEDRIRSGNSNPSGHDDSSVENP